MAENMRKKRRVSDACADLCYVGKMTVCNMDYDCVAGKSRVSLVVYQKKNKIYGVQGDMAFAKFSLEKLGFKDVFADGVDGIMVVADTVIEYDINKKTYTITKANLQELKALEEVMNVSRASVCISRNEPDLVSVPVAEFKQAVANYIAQNQK